MSNLLDQLYDIEGIDPIHWWPLALGWWIIIVFLVVCLLGLVIYYYRKRALKRSWQYRILTQLSLMEQNLKEGEIQPTLIELSQLIRRIAIHRYSRLECAGLEGKSWLYWLKNQDPHQFDWETKGKCLLEAPYSPSYHGIPHEDIIDLIKAIRKWVK
ncbi:MAG: DUF4381 domain-containing protein [Alphaproteobacteria bacterium]|nr:DUF4381 domain-containing protein [Alphaproteobacteria bacterium]